jgi:L-ascorbate 6-phosphate lactonase
MAPESDSAGLSLRYLGQVGFLIERNGLRIVIDPFFSGSNVPDGSIWVRNYPAPLPASELTGIDLVLCTHDHGDHTDPKTLLGILAASPGCRFAGPKPSVQIMEKGGLPADRITVLNEGTPFKIGDLTVDPVAAAHEDYETDAEGFHRFLGYLLHWDGLTLYHSGDTVVTERLEQAVGRHAINLGFLPINGRDETRRRQDIVGNMNGAEALDLATRLHRQRGFDLLVPTHYDLFSCNGACLDAFAQAWRNLPGPKPGLKSFQPGEEWHYPAGKPQRSGRPLV